MYILIRFFHNFVSAASPSVTVLLANISFIVMGQLFVVSGNIIVVSGKIFIVIQY